MLSIREPGELVWRKEPVADGRHPSPREIAAESGDGSASLLTLVSPGPERIGLGRGESSLPKTISLRLFVLLEITRRSGSSSSGHPKHQQTSDPRPGHPRPAPSENPRVGAPPRLGHQPAPAIHFRRRAAGQRRIALSGPAQARAGRLDHRRVEADGEQPAREVLRADAARPEELESEAANWQRLSAAISYVVQLSEA